MQETLWVLFATGAYPLWKAWMFHRKSPLIYAICWTILAWAGWGGLITLSMLPEYAGGLQFYRFIALSLTGCAGVAVLGARRPGAAAWNFVILALILVMLLPLAEQVIVGNQSPGWPRAAFLIGTLLIIFLNYLPTCMTFGALLFAFGCGWEVWSFLFPDQAAFLHSPGWWAMALVPWAGYVGWLRQPAPPSKTDAVWLFFRNCYGLLWGLRAREQFNRSAENAGWPVQLHWQGLRVKTGHQPPDEIQQAEILATLLALLKRFRPEEG